jgi:hypothetical protein
VLDKLVDGGLIVTDGSMCDAGTNPYREFQTLSGQEMVSAEEAVRSVSAFSDDEGREFQCIGCLGQDHHGHGPTMIWQVHRR